MNSISVTAESLVARAADAVRSFDGERLSEILDAIPAAVYTTDAEGRLTHFNRAAIEFSGRVPSLGSDQWCVTWKLYHPDGRPLPHDQCPMAVALKEGRPVRGVEAIAERPDGTRLAFLPYPTPLRNQAGQVVGGVNMLVDITDRKRAENALRQSERELARRTNQLSTFLETAAIALHRVGPDGTILWANDAELKMLGYEAHEYIGRHIAEFHADPAAIRDILARLTAGEKLRDCEARLRCKDGSTRTVLIDSSVYREDGCFVHTQCFTRDITGEKLAEELRGRLAAIVDSSDDAIVGTDLDGVISAWNRGAARLYGYSEAQALGHHISLIIPEEAVAMQKEALERLRRGERPQYFDTVRRAKDGREIPVSLAISPILGRDGSIIGTARVARDITERKRMESELKEEARRKDEFLATLSHELRNPLAPIRNAVELLARLGDDAAVRKDAQAILERQVRQMAKLVDDLMELTRISRGIVRPDLRHVALDEIVRNAVEISRPLLDECAHRLEISLPPQRVRLHADPVRIAQILCNLLNNAAKYTPAGGSVALAANVRGAEAIISVRDNGVGIAPEMLPRLFEMFERAGQSELGGKGGLGIGLSIARSLARLHGGELEARSAGAGKGSEFVVRLPLAAAAVEIAQPRLNEEMHAGKTPRRVLIADDNVDAAQTTAAILRHMGHAVYVVHDGEAALRGVRERLPEVLLLDLSLPGLDGYAVASRLRADARFASLRLVALTGHGLESHRARSREAGFDLHLVKPVEVDRLARAIDGD